MIVHLKNLKKFVQVTLTFSIYTISTSVAYGQLLSINPDGTINGQAIHISDDYAYYRCEDVASEQLIDVGFMWLSGYATELGVAEPQDRNCVVSQGLPGSFFAGLTSLDYFISPANSVCWIKGSCYDTRSLNPFVKEGILYINLMVLNLDKEISKQRCLAVDGDIINNEGCALLN
mgnify:CR=1 FL=1|jgi:hypothetical protein|tara:strand:+ start:155 stop:679 length:525 start_codon:yes stop_codon:yes gene_type:complete